MKQNFLRMLALALVICITAASLVGCMSSEDAELPENMQHATVAGADYRLYLPADWNLLIDTGVSGGYASMQNKVIIYVKEYENLDGLTETEYWTDVHADVIRAAFPTDQSFTATEPVETKLGETDAISVGYTGTRDLVTYQGQEILCSHNNRIYVLTFCAQKDLYEGYLAVLDNVKTSFRFSDTPFEPNDPINTVDPNAEAPDGMMLASNDDVAYRFYVPDTWVLNTALPTSSAYVSESDRSNISVTSFIPEETYNTAEQYWESCLAQISTAMTVTSEVTVTQTTLDGRPANIYEYSATVGETSFRFAQTIATYRDMIYTVTYTALADSYDTHRDTYLDILAAFDFRGN